MLEVSETAATMLDDARDARDLPDSYGVRVSGEATPEGEIALSLTFTDGPMEGDEVAEQGETQVFVDPELAAPLADSMIDVADTPEGTQLVIKPQDADEDA